ncbi:hypothetical protein JHK86_021497 [Glycine max]|nr:hypothetical protein JHK86_021497 [Glycine max]
MEASIMLPLERTSSIEREPMTLNINQIQSARGLQPVVSAAPKMGLGEEVEVLDSKVASVAAFRDIASAPF